MNDQRKMADYLPHATLVGFIVFLIGACFEVPTTQLVALFVSVVFGFIVGIIDLKGLPWKSASVSILFLCFVASSQAQDDLMVRKSPKAGSLAFSKRLDSVQLSTWLNKSTSPKPQAFRVLAGLATDGKLTHVAVHILSEILIDDDLYIFAEVGVNQATTKSRDIFIDERPTLIYFFVGPRIEPPFRVQTGLNGLSAFFQLGAGIAARDGYKPRAGLLMKGGFGTKDEIMFFISYLPFQNRGSMGLEGSIMDFVGIPVSAYNAVSDLVSIIGKLTLSN